MSNTTTLNRTTRLTVTAILSAIVVTVSFLPLKTLGFEITLSMVPVAIGAMLYGPLTGAILGGVFGVVSFLQCFGYSSLGVLLLEESPLLTAVTCIPTRILAGWVTGLIFSLVCRCGDKGTEIAYPVASLVAPILNTAFFMTALVLCFYRTDTIQYYVDALGAKNPFVFILLFVGINAVAEIVAGFVIAYPVARAMVRYVGRKRGHSHS